VSDDNPAVRNLPSKSGSGSRQDEGR